MPDLDRFRVALERRAGEHKVVDSPEHRMQYAFDASGIATPYPPDLVFHPETTGDVRVALELADRYGVPVVPRGAGTGVTGGALAVKGGLMIVFDRMNRILEVDRESLQVHVEPGVITGDLHRAVEAEGLFYPPDPASLSMCSIGGNVAENAGGPRALKYGVTRHYVLALEAVIPGGTVLSLGRPTRKWVAGYDLPGLFVGSEGTFGAITRITLQVLPRPGHVVGLWALFRDEEEAARAATEILHAGVLPRALEFADRFSMDVIREDLPDLPDEARAFLLVELDGDEPAAVEPALFRVGEILDRRALDVRVGEGYGQMDRIWEARRKILPALEKMGRVRSEDVVVPRRHLVELVRRVHALREASGLVITAFGHIGDGNLHVNFVAEDPASPEILPWVEKLYRQVFDLGGTMAGEHGVGLLKRDFLPLEVDPVTRALSREIKRLFDPRGIMNPGKIWPDEG